MLIVVTGVASCGKSSLAEDIACRLGGDKLYVATMINASSDADSRIERHKKKRADKNFETIERAYDIETIEFQPVSTILLECATTLLANETFERAMTAPLDKVMLGVDNLKSRSRDLVVVSSDICAGVLNYEEATLNFIKANSYMNRKFAEKADIFIECVYGVPNFLKGKDLYEKII